MKVCRKCLETKAVSEFNKHPQTADRLWNSCKRCQHAQQKEMDARPERVAARKAYAKTAASRESLLRAVKRYGAEFPERVGANTTARNALKSGKLLRQLCFVCGDEAEMHHPDYSSPLDVVWMCRRHHLETHALAKELAA